jgi:hypothetical protein
MGGSGGEEDAFPAGDIGWRRRAGGVDALAIRAWPDHRKPVAYELVHSIILEGERGGAVGRRVELPGRKPTTCRCWSGCAAPRRWLVAGGW